MDWIGNKRFNADSTKFKNQIGILLSEFWIIENFEISFTSEFSKPKLNLLYSARLSKIFELGNYILIGTQIFQHFLESEMFGHEIKNFRSD